MEMNASKAPPATKNFSREAKFRGQKKMAVLYRRRIMRLDELGKTFVIRLVIRL